MDPLSIASSVVGLTTTCLSTCKKLYDLAREFEDVPAIVAMICSESTIISIGLSELQMKILQRDDLAQAWASMTEIWMAFETALTGCMVVFSCLEAETRSLRSENPGLWAKIKFLWNQDRLKELLGALRAQQSCITFLLNLLELDTLSKIQKDIWKNAQRIKAAASQAQSLRSCNPSVKMDVESIFDNDAVNLSFFHSEAVSGMAPSELDFEFDDVVINSQAYRRVFIKARSETQKLHVDDVDSDTGTIKEADQGPSNYRQSQEESGNQPKPLCEEDFIRRRDIQCFKCHETIIGDFIAALDRRYHRDHLTCDECETAFTKKSDCHQQDDGIYCMLHFCRDIAYYCDGCKFPIMEECHVSDQQGGKWHSPCFNLSSSWGLELPVSPNGHRYLDFIQEKSQALVTKANVLRKDARADELTIFTSAFQKLVKDYIQGRQPSSQVVGLHVSELLQPLLKVTFQAYLQDRETSWDVENDELDGIINALGAVGTHELGDRYSQQPTGAAEED
ncbi:hypothetical protein FGADI_4181 [Fusarium gaditjirri]|uniref:LIM zinc-binding domain-containing protein n=1 Tax=Fusarium gaditjirri TaxID=282569 RepID=A0A8H4TDK9_9HYPO|nr:hypothetical protein FGADI_4181 [Fusarium gaditjirri]